MDWIERLFGISPDGGNGLVETLVVLSVVAIPVTAWLLWRRRA